MKGSRDSLKALRIFLVAARTLNFSRSGEELHLTQSAVSKNISALEKKLGTALFKRTPAGLRLTYAGTLYLERVSAALHLIDEADAVVGHRGARAALNILSAGDIPDVVQEAELRQALAVTCALGYTALRKSETDLNRLGLRQEAD